MRRLVFPIIVGLGLVMIGSSSASAEDPTPAATVSAKATPGKKLCKISDPRLDEISGLVATRNGYVVINDGTETENKKKIFFLDSKCAVDEEKTQDYSGDGPKDPEDLVLSADGDTLWIADVGDGGIRSGQEPRPTVALWSMPANGSKKPVLYRLSYPDGDAHDAEAMLLNGDGTPLIVTKEIGKTAGVYQPTGPLKAKSSEGVPMKRVMDLPINATETAGNAVARIGNKTITGGAVAPGGGKVVLRTYTDALEWDVTNGDVLAALKKEPRTTGLPNEPFGEAIAYSTDGKTFLTVSDMNGDKEIANNVRQYTPATTVAKKSDKSGDAEAGDPWYLSVDNLTYAVAGVGAFGVILVGVGVFGIMRFRRSPQAAGPNVDDAPSGGLKTTDPETELIGVGGAPQRAGVYGGGGRPGGGGPVYGAQSGPPAGGQPRGNGPVYGSGGPQYGRPGGGQQPPRGPQQGRPQQGRPQQGRPQQGGGPQQGRPQQGRPQQQPGRTPTPPPVRGPQRGGPQQQPPRGPQQQPGRGGGGGGGGGVYGGGGGGGGPQQQPPRGPQQGRGPQRSPGVYGGGGRPPQDGTDNRNGYR